MQKLPIFTVDAFTDKPFAGNPAAVCLLRAPRDEVWMQNVAREMNLSETAFVQARDGDFDLRWFTPSTEVDLCGHATLASAHILWETGQTTTDKIRFHTRSGVLTAQRSGARITLDFPATPEQTVADFSRLTCAMGVAPVYVGKSQFDYLFEVESQAQVQTIAPDLAMLKMFPARGVIVTSRADAPEIDFVSRFFGPAVGVDEDPVTGSAHCCLAPFWAARLNKKRLSARQISPRGGDLTVELYNDRVLIGGQAITIMRGEIVVS